LPFIPGWDVSGVIEEVGAGAVRLKGGDEVYTRPDMTRDGAYAEYLVVRESEVALKPTSLDHVHAAAIPLAALTAWQSLFDAGGLTAGQMVLIHAAAGSVGSFAVQLARWKGAHVIGTASAHSQQFLRELGADETIDYNAVRFEDVVRDVEVVVDTMGGETQKRSWKTVKEGGILVAILVGLHDFEDPPPRGVRNAQVAVQPNADQLAEIAKLADSGKLRTSVETTLPLALARRARNSTRLAVGLGKIVLMVV
jgi:NADPH:quinone reductase-like Zn-dependent oxidoreductase